MPAFQPRRPLRALFIHQNFPGQYAHLAPALAQRTGVQVWGMGEKEATGAPSTPGVRYAAYGTPRGAGEQTHRYLRPLEAAVRRGQLLANRLTQLRDKEGLRPDVVVCHPGWGEGLFVKDVFPDARALFYWEFYYNAVGQDLGFDPAQPVTPDDSARLRMLNATQLISLQVADWGVSPTQWQKSRFPDWAQRRITCLHEGVDTTRCAPREGAVFRTSTGHVFRKGDPVISYVARNLEPYRGFPSFMRALALMQKERRDLHAVVVGGDEVSYGRKPDGAATWREKMLEELGDRIDPARIHFTGRIPHPALHDLFRVTAAHVYLTYPFVLSWSLLESMACGAVVVGSDTPPVAEAITHGETGLLVPFFAPDQIAETTLRVLADPAGHAHLGVAARQSVIARYDLYGVCLPRQLELVERVAAGAFPATGAG